MIEFPSTKFGSVPTPSAWLSWRSDTTLPIRQSLRCQGSAWRAGCPGVALLRIERFVERPVAECHAVRHAELGSLGIVEGDGLGVLEPPGTHPTKNLRVRERRRIVVNTEPGSIAPGLLCGIIAGVTTRESREAIPAHPAGRFAIPELPPRRASMTSASSPQTIEPTTAPAQSGYDNQGQYSRTGILRYEKIFGEGYISTGGHEHHRVPLISKIEPSSLKPGVRVLDVGSGIGGAAFHLAKTYGAVVTGGGPVARDDQASPTSAPRRLAERRLDRPERSWGMSLPSRISPTKFGDHLEPRRPDAHPRQGSPIVQRTSHSLTEPGGKLVITDYAQAALGRTAPPSSMSYIEKTGYHVVDPTTYGQFIEAAGYKSTCSGRGRHRPLRERSSSVSSTLLETNRSRLPPVVLRGRPELPRRPLADEGWLLPGRRHEVGHLPGHQAGLTDDLKNLGWPGSTVLRNPGAIGSTPATIRGYGVP